MSDYQPPSIQAFFPPFGQEEIADFERECCTSERVELDAMFEWCDIVNPQSSRYVICTSLYCSPHDPEKRGLGPLSVEVLQAPHPSVKGGASWWANYMAPMLANFAWVPEPWAVRVYLAADLTFLLPYLRHPKVEVRVMRTSSINTMPGMLWRYMPMDDGVTLMARGADSLRPVAKDWAAMQRMLAGPNHLFRVNPPPDTTGNGYLTYRAIPGPILLKPVSEIGFREAAKAWIWHQRHFAWASSVHVASYPDEAAQEMKKSGMTHWARYAQDEQFLSHWLYYRVASAGIHTLIEPDRRGVLWGLDAGYLEGVCNHHVVDYID